MKYALGFGLAAVLCGVAVVVTLTRYARLLDNMAAVFESEY